MTSAVVYFGTPRDGARSSREQKSLSVGSRRPDLVFPEGRCGATDTDNRVNKLVGEPTALASCPWTELGPSVCFVAQGSGCPLLSVHTYTITSEWHCQASNIYQPARLGQFGRGLAGTGQKSPLNPLAYLGLLFRPLYRQRLRRKPPLRWPRLRSVRRRWFSSFRVNWSSAGNFRLTRRRNILARRESSTIWSTVSVTVSYSRRTTSSLDTRRSIN